MFQENIGLALNALYNFVYKGSRIVYMWGPVFSTTSFDLCRLGPYYNIPEITMALSERLFNKAIYNYTLQIYPDILPEAQRAIVRYFGWKKVSVVIQDGESKWHLAMLTLIRLLEDDNVTVLSVSSLKSDNADDVIRVLKSFDTRITFLGLHKPASANLLCAAYKQGMYGPKYVYIMPGWYYTHWWRKAPTDCTPEEMDNVTKGYIGLDPFPVTDNVEIVNFTGKPPNEEEMNFYKAFRASILESYSYNAYSYDMIWTIALALNSADNILRHSKNGKRIHEFMYNDSDIAHLVWEETRTLVVHGMTGRISFGENGLRYAPNAIEQLQDETEVTVCSYDILADEMSCNYGPVDFKWAGGTPPVDGVTYVENILTLSDVYIWVIYSLTTIEVLMAIGLIGMSIVYRNNRVMRISSAMVTIFIPIGCLFLNLGVVLFGVDLSSVPLVMMPVICQVREGCIWIGLSLGFGALFAKTYRVHVIFNTALRKMKTVKNLEDGKLILFILLLVAVDVAILVARLVVDTTSLESFSLESSMDLSKPPLEIMTTQVAKLCSSEYQLYFFLAVLVYKSILFMFGTLLAWKTRSVEVSELNDSPYIALSVYLTVVTCIIATPVGIVMQTNVNAVFLVVGGAILIVNATVLSLVYVPKIIVMSKEQTLSKSSTKRNFLAGDFKGSDSTRERKAKQELSDKIQTNQEMLKKMKLALSSTQLVADLHGGTVATTSKA
ncbi:gamma-aminobutyric acid type B receptor subunit 2-like [Glandiceps talaboti]